MFVLRGGLTRGQFGLLNEGLYQHAYSGTKKIVERYLEVRVFGCVCVCVCMHSFMGAGRPIYHSTRHSGND
jgi:hypothetical protein